jgi:hypothetical protein
MKTIIIFICFALLTVTGFGQNKDIDNIFNKFEGKNGVTSINITKDMMELAAQLDSGDLKVKDLIAQISSVKILALENDATPEDKVSFNNMVKSLSLNDYKELIVVKEKDTDVKMLSKDIKGKIVEFLLLVTGGKDQVLVRIDGNIDPKLLGKLSQCVNMKGCEQLAKLDKK